MYEFIIFITYNVIYFLKVKNIYSDENLLVPNHMIQINYGFVMWDSERGTKKSCKNKSVGAIIDNCWFLTHLQEWTWNNSKQEFLVLISTLALWSCMALMSNLVCWAECWSQIGEVGIGHALFLAYLYNDNSSDCTRIETIPSPMM